MEKLIKTANGQWQLLNKNFREAELGITSDKGKIKFEPGFDQKKFQEYVLSRADHIPKTGFAIGKPTDFNWHFDPEFDIDKTNALKRDWVAWYNGELDEWRYDHGDERAGHFEAWSKNPARKPIIMIEGTDGKMHCWDGHHRIGMAHIKKMKHIPVIIGIRKTGK